MSAKVGIWMPLYIGDYLADTMHLTTEQHGAYLLLIMAYWKNGGPLPSSDQQLAAICRLSQDSWVSYKSVICGFFEDRDGLLVHERIEDEIAGANKNKSKRSMSGSKGAQAKWGEPSSAKETRSERLANARRLARHLPEEWEALKNMIGCCVRCGCEGELVKDHIKPIYQGGSDGIDNLQPLCRSCNASKGPESVDFRPIDWKERLAKRLANACPSPSPLPIKIKSSSVQLADHVPCAEIFDAYAESLPTLPQLKIKDDARKRAIKSLWRQSEKFQTVDFWRRYFKYVSGIPFLMGMRGIGFDWLMKPANFKKVLEGNYQDA